MGSWGVMLRTRGSARSEEHTSELQSRRDLVCRLLLEKKQRGSADRYRRAQCKRRRPDPHRPGWSETARRRDQTVQASRCGKPWYDVLHRFFFNDTATTEIYTLSLHDALPI